MGIYNKKKWRKFIKIWRKSIKIVGKFAKKEYTVAVWNEFYKEDLFWFLEIKEEYIHIGRKEYEKTNVGHFSSGNGK